MARGWEDTKGRDGGRGLTFGAAWLWRLGAASLPRPLHATGCCRTRVIACYCMLIEAQQPAGGSGQHFYTGWAGLLLVHRAAAPAARPSGKVSVREELRRHQRPAVEPHRHPLAHHLDPHAGPPHVDQVLHQGRAGRGSVCAPPGGRLAAAAGRPASACRQAGWGSSSSSSRWRARLHGQDAAGRAAAGCVGGCRQAARQAAKGRRRTLASPACEPHPVISMAMYMDASAKTR